MFSPICNFSADLNVLSGAVFLYPSALRFDKNTYCDNIL